MAAVSGHSKMCNTKISLRRGAPRIALFGRTKKSTTRGSRERREAPDRTAKSPTSFQDQGLRAFA